MPVKKHHQLMAPVLFVLVGMLGLTIEILSLGNQTGFLSLARSENTITVTGKIEKVSPCINKLLCFKIVEQAPGVTVQYKNAGQFNQQNNSNSRQFKSSGIKVRSLSEEITGPVPGNDTESNPPEQIEGNRPIAANPEQPVSGRPVTCLKDAGGEPVCPATPRMDLSKCREEGGTIKPDAVDACGCRIPPTCNLPLPAEPVNPPNQPEPGCYYQDVQCFRAPCPRSLVCPMPANSYYIASWSNPRPMFFASCLFTDKSKCIGRGNFVNLNNFVGKYVTIKGKLSSHSNTPYILVQSMNEIRQCPAYTPVLCPDGSITKPVEVDENGCPLPPVCSPITPQSQCQNEPDGESCKIKQCLCPENATGCEAPCSVVEGSCNNGLCVSSPVAAPPVCRCRDGSACPANDIRECPGIQQAPEPGGGNPLPVPATCYCPDGSACPAGLLRECPGNPIQPQTCRCTDGSSCPANDIRECPNNPAEPQTCRCPDGSACPAGLLRECPGNPAGPVPGNGGNVYYPKPCAPGQSPACTEDLQSMTYPPTGQIKSVPSTCSCGLDDVHSLEENGWVRTNTIAR